MTRNEKSWMGVLSVVYVMGMPILISVIAGWDDMPGFIKHLGGQTAAAWVQALGSIAAIFGSVWIANGGARKRRAEKEDEEIGRLQRVANHARIAVMSIDQLIDRVEGRKARAITSNAARAAIRTLERYPLELIPNGQAALAAPRLTARAEHLLDAYARWDKSAIISDGDYLSTIVDGLKAGNEVRIIRSDRRGLDGDFKRIVEHWQGKAFPGEDRSRQIQLFMMGRSLSSDAAGLED